MFITCQGRSYSTNKSKSMTKRSVITTITTVLEPYYSTTASRYWPTQKLNNTKFPDTHHNHPPHRHSPARPPPTPPPPPTRTSAGWGGGFAAKYQVEGDLPFIFKAPLTPPTRQRLSQQTIQQHDSNTPSVHSPHSPPHSEAPTQLTHASLTHHFVNMRTDVYTDGSFVRASIRYGTSPSAGWGVHFTHPAHSDSPLSTDTHTPSYLAPSPSPQQTHCT